MSIPCDYVSRGSTSVVGSILLVAVVVMLGASIVVFTPSLTGVGSSGVATFNIVQNGAATDAEQPATVTITYETGTLDTARGEVQILTNGQIVFEVEGVKFEHSGFESFTPGATATLVQTTGAGLTGRDVISVVLRKGTTGTSSPRKH